MWRFSNSMQGVAKDSKKVKKKMHDKIIKVTLKTIFTAEENEEIKQCVSEPFEQTSWF